MSNNRRTGWLITNAFLQGEKFTQLADLLCAAFAGVGLTLVPYTNADFLVSYGADGARLLTHEGTPAGMLPSFVLFWDKDVTLARAFEAQGLRVFNRADAIAACDDKLLTHRLLAGQGVLMPRTIAAPLTFPGVGYAIPDNNTRPAFLAEAGRTLGFPLVIKESAGSFGAQVYLARDENEAGALLSRLAGKRLLLQEFVRTSCGRDVRIHVVGGKVVTAMLRTNANDFRANITNGGKMSAYTPTEAETALAIRACALLKLDFAGVDLLFSEDDGPMLCEVNSNAHFKNIRDCTGVNVADAIARYIASVCES